ncbi:MAG: protease complex subunit PrcB family protein [Elusimicrobia bacterium]|nr:protease complex subunit PrcB family protein [Elusimicrobiota bacterium]
MIAAAAALSLLLAADAAHAASKSKTPAKETPSMIELSPADASPQQWTGTASNESKARSLIISDRASWERAWKTSIGADAPAADFAKHVAVAVFLGTRNTGGYSVEFLEPRVADGKAVIRFREKKPGKGRMVIQVLTNPYGVKLFRKTTLKLSIAQEP